jgi:hypothetical protein
VVSDRWSFGGRIGLPGSEFGSVVVRVFVFPGTFPLGFGAKALNPGLYAALLFLLGFGRVFFRAGELNDETRAGLVACLGFADDGDGVGFLTGPVAETGRATATGSLGPLGRRGFATALWGRFLGRLSGLGWVGYLGQLLHLDRLVLNNCSMTGIR